MQTEELISFVDSVKCPVLRNLFHEDTGELAKSFKIIDTGQSGDITFVEW